MSSRLFDEPEQYLLEHWEEALRLEASMLAVRLKYEALCNLAYDALKSECPQLNKSKAFIYLADSRGTMMFAKSDWPGRADDTQSGFWIEYLSLSHLLVESAEPVKLSIWVSKRAAPEFGFETARQKLRETANQLLPPEVRDGLRDGEGEYLLRFPAPSRKDLLAALGKPDSGPFVRLLVEHFKNMTPLISTVDEMFAVRSK